MMISAWWLLAIVPAVMLFGFCWGALLAGAKCGDA